MKKNYLSVLVILITIILIGYMVISGRKEESGYMMVENQKNEVISEKAMDDFIREIEENKQEKIKVTKEFKYNDEKTKDKAKKIIENDLNSEKEKKQDIDLKEKKDLQVFKIDKNLIMDRLTFKEKKELAKIIKTLSMNDYALIIESIKNDGELECIIKINTILEERLSKDRYNSIREILKPFINLEIL